VKAPYRWIYWRVEQTFCSPYLRPHIILAAHLGHFKLPDFIIIGSERGGTSSLYVYLTNEPRIVAALRKEIDFFDQKYQKGWTWYLGHFVVAFSNRAIGSKLDNYLASRTYEESFKKPLLSKIISRLRSLGYLPFGDTSNLLTGEASVSCLFFPEAAERVAKSLPNTRIIVLLRDPVERAYSHYQHELAMGYEYLSFEDALRRECVIDGGKWRLRNLREKSMFEYVHFSYLAKGLYAEQLKCWMEKIPRDRFLILKSEDFFNDPSNSFAQVLQFLGLPRSNRIAFRKYNEGNYQPLDATLRDQLKEFYEPHNEELSRFLGLDLSDWC